MAIINTGAVERTITGVNESEVNSQATIMNLVENSDSGDYGNNPASDSLVESPDGTISAVMPIPDSNSDRFEYLIDGGTYPTDTKLVYSWYRKRVTTPLNTSYIGDLRITSLSNMTNTGLIAQIETDVNGFDRFQAVVNITDGSLPSKVRGYFGYSIGVGNSSVAYWGHQLETGEEARAYAPTNGAALFIDNNSTSVVTNTGAVEREIEASHDANFVHPLGDELILNNDFSDGTNNWTELGSSNIIIGTYEGRSNVANVNILNTSTGSRIQQDFNYVNGKKYEVSVEVYLVSGDFRLDCRDSFVSGDFVSTSTTGSWLTLSAEIEANTTGTDVLWLRSSGKVSQFYVSNVSIKEVLVNRESTVNNTGVVERDIEGVNESDEMFPDNTESSVLNVGEEILPLLESLESRSTYYENEQNTVNILKNLNC